MSFARHAAMLALAAVAAIFVAALSWMQSDSPFEAAASGTTLVTSASLASNREPEVRVASVSTRVGQRATVSVEALGFKSPGLGGWVVDVTYDSDIVSVVGCDVPETDAIQGVCNPAFDADSIRFVGTAWPGLLGDGRLGTVTFECQNEGSSVLYLAVEVLADATYLDPQPVEAIASNGAIGCTPPRSLAVGDVDCDGNINSIDATLILQVTAGLIISLECPDNSDVNQDATVSVLDALLILQFNAGLIDQLPP